MDAPERIWAEPDGDTILIHNGAPNLAGLIATGYLTEYIRVDLMAELVEALRECHDALRDHAKMYPHMVKGFTHDAEKRAAATLALIAHNTTEGGCDALFS